VDPLVADLTEGRLTVPPPSGISALYAGLPLHWSWKGRNSSAHLAEQGCETHLTQQSSEIDTSRLYYNHTRHVRKRLSTGGAGFQELAASSTMCVF